MAAYKTGQPRSQGHHFESGDGPGNEVENWNFPAFEIIYPVLENAFEMDTPF